MDQQGGLSFCDMLLCWDLRILNVSFEMFSMMMCPQEKERCYSKFGFMFRTSGFCGGDPLWVDTVV